MPEPYVEVRALLVQRLTADGQVFWLRNSAWMLVHSGLLAAMAAGVFAGLTAVAMAGFGLVLAVAAYLGVLRGRRFLEYWETQLREVEAPLAGAHRLARPDIPGVSVIWLTHFVAGLFVVGWVVALVAVIVRS